MPQSNYGAEFSNYGYLPLKGATRPARGPPAGGQLGNAFPGENSLRVRRVNPTPAIPIVSSGASRWKIQMLITSR